MQTLDTFHAETTKARQRSTAKKWMWFCWYAGIPKRLFAVGCTDPSPTQKLDAEVKMMCFVSLLEKCYEYNTIVAYVQDVQNLQMQWNGYVSLKSLGVVFIRVSMMIKSIKKKKPVYREKKRLWLPEYFAQIAGGAGWHGAVPHRQWCSFLHMQMWIVLVLKYMLVLRQGEVVKMPVARSTERRPWSRASVTFFAGGTKVPMLHDGRPDPKWYPFLTSVELDSVPDKTNWHGSRDPFHVKVFDRKTMTSKTALPPFLFCGGRLLWSLFTLFPVPTAYADLVPLFMKEYLLPPRVVKQFDSNDYAKGLCHFCANAVPVIPRKLNGKTLGGHCMRGAAAMHALKLGATLTELCSLARWSVGAFIKNKGHDYTRQHLKPTAHISTSLMVAVMVTAPVSAVGGQHSVVPGGR